MKKWIYREINPWTLKIGNPTTRERYKKETNKYTLGQFRLALFMAIIFYTSFLMCEAIGYEARCVKMVQVQIFYIVPILIIILFSTILDMYNKHIIFIHLLTALTMGVGSIMINYFGKESIGVGQGYAGIILVYVLIYMFLEVPYLYLGLIGTLIGIIYNILDYKSLDEISFSEFLPTLVLLLISNSIGVAIAYHRERYAKETSILRHKLAERTIKDELTGLTNRRYFDEVCMPDIQVFMERAHSVKNIKRRMGDIRTAKYGLIMLDIDHFKRVNDSFGHSSGDLVLKQFADILQSSIRKSDDVMRIGGEEFLIVIKLTTESYLTQFIKNLGKRIESYDFVIENSNHICCTVSMGMVILPDKWDVDINTLIGYADRALYRSKDEGRNRGNKVYSLHSELEFKEIKWSSTTQNS